MSSETVSILTIPPPDYVDEREVARRLCMSRFAIQRWRYHGGGPPFVKLGKSIRYKWIDVVEWAESRKVGA